MEQASHFDSKSNFPVCMYYPICVRIICIASNNHVILRAAFFFLVASLLSSLHQLKDENIDLEDSVDRMVQRRDHLLAVRARLLALSNISVATSGNGANQTGGNDCSTS